MKATFNWSSFLATVPESPGVYLMCDASSRVLYVGKARHLKNRLTSYSRGQQSVKTAAMLSHVTAIQLMDAPSETDALLLEARLIKQHKPRYNIILRDDKTYPYILLETDKTYPRLDFYRGPVRSGGRYFGPYPSAGSIREMLAILQKIFQLRSCSDRFFRHRQQPCIQYQMKRCTAPCVGYVTEKEYRQQVRYVEMFLSGQTERVIAHLYQSMQTAASEKAYERAAKCRDQMEQLQQLSADAIHWNTHVDLDVIGVVNAQSIVAMSVVMIRAGRFFGQCVFQPKDALERDAVSLMSSCVSQYYLDDTLRHVERPSCIVLPLEWEEHAAFASALMQLWEAPIEVVAGPQPELESWQVMAEKQAEKAVLRHIEKQDVWQARWVALARRLPSIPSLERVECFDISHTGGAHTVGSCVVFDENGPCRSAYRFFKLSGVTPGDDYAAMREVLKRRYTAIKKNMGILPDLVIVDGGKGQLKQAETVFSELQLSGIVLMGIAKGPDRRPGEEQILLSGVQAERWPPQDDALHALQYIRDEAHRFAITQQRRQRAKAQTDSVLLDIPGVGAHRARLLLKILGGWQGVRDASVKDLQSVPGIGQKTAEAIYQVLHPASDET